ncbi:MAG TPA: dienelactone hydrolase family protein [Candidatus Acidoferrales bacterium]|nr:dienelactone hydrolase family protein [Candidatus Acidoferrales bacterium]
MLAQVKIDNRIDAHLGQPARAGKRPVVIHLHERYGIVKHTLDLAEKLVQAGYVTLAPDLYWRFTGDREALARGDARAELKDEEVLKDLDDIVAYLAAVPTADLSRIAMIGVCATGRQPVLAAVHRSDIAAAVVLYGAIYPADWQPHALRPEPINVLLERVRCPVLGIFGELDNLVPRENVLKMRNVLEAAGKSFDIRIYPDAPHGFLNDTMPGRYRAEQARAAWNQVLSFLDSALEKGWDKRRAVWRFESDTSLDYDFGKNRRWE